MVQGPNGYCTTVYHYMGSMGTMKTTLDIQDALLIRAKESARQQGRSLRSLVEEGLRHVLVSSPQRNKYKLPDLSVGQAGAPDPLEEYSWQDLRELIYEDRESG